MTRAVLDTNVLVSALINPYGPARHIFNAFRQGSFELVTSVACLLELERVLSRLHIRRTYKLGEDDIYGYILVLGTRGTVVAVPEETGPMCSDPGDDKFLVCALVADAEVVVSGDPDLLAMNGVLDIAVMTPKDFAVTVLGGWQPTLPGIG